MRSYVRLAVNACVPWAKCTEASAAGSGEGHNGKRPWNGMPQRWNRLAVCDGVCGKTNMEKKGRERAYQQASVPMHGLQGGPVSSLKPQKTSDHVPVHNFPAQRAGLGEVDRPGPEEEPSKICRVVHVHAQLDGK